jgi:hypothetical protein
MKTFARLLLVAFALAAGCAAEDIDSPEPAAASTPVSAPDEPVAAQENALDGRFFMCGGHQCENFTHFCCNNSCATLNTICRQHNPSGINE